MFAVLSFKPLPLPANALPCYPRKELARMKERTYAINYYREHREKQIDYSKRRYRRHKKYFLDYMQNHKTRHCQLNKEYYRRNKELQRDRLRSWSRRHRDIRRKYRAQRRTLGFIPINKIFEGSHAHHLDPSHVCFVPEELHNSVRHNLWTGKNMKEINAKVFEWLEETNQTPSQEILSIL